MTIDLNISGGFTLNVADGADDEAVLELIRKIEAEANAALSMVAYRHKLGFMDIELQKEEEQ